MQNFRILSLEQKDIWNTYLIQLPINQQDIYYTPEYYQLHEELGDGKANCFVFEKDGDLALYPFLLNSVNDLGFELSKNYFDIQGAYGYNGIVSSSYNRTFIASFYNVFREYIQDANIIAEFTRFHPLLNNYKFSESNLEIFFDRNTMFLELNKNYEDIFNAFQVTTKKQIKRCHHKYNLEVEIIENDTSQLETFYTIYTEAMARVQAIQYLYLNIEYFRKLISTTKSALFIAKHEGKPIAAIIAFYNDYYIHGHLGGALTDFLNTSSYSLLYSEMIKFGLKKSCRFFHAGGGTSSKIDDKLLQFKLNFSKTVADFYIGKQVCNSVIYTNVINQWEKRFPEKKEIFQNRILKYRF